MSETITGYDVGALLYCPANSHHPIVDALTHERFPRPFSLAFCLEDTVREEAVGEAEDALAGILGQIAAQAQRQAFYLPHIFIRVRSPLQLRRLAARYAPFASILTGFILPKFFVDNCGGYLQAIGEIRSVSGLDPYYMPIFESAAMIDPVARQEGLAAVREQLAAVSDRILNIRVGGNDLCHAFGLRRHVCDTIYDVRPVAAVLVDIASAFSTQYVVSGPVWEFYAGEGWDTGLRRELAQDLLSGFIGKTVIHPAQIPVVNEVLQVSRADYEDARSILSWDGQDPHLVCASAAATRMNEYQTHHRWAAKTLRLAQVYGVREG